MEEPAAGFARLFGVVLASPARDSSVLLKAGTDATMRSPSVESPECRIDGAATFEWEPAPVNDRPTVEELEHLYTWLTREERDEPLQELLVAESHCGGNSRGAGPGRLCAFREPLPS